MCPRRLWLSLLLAAVAPAVSAVPPPGYDAPAQRQTGVVLRLALDDIIKGHTVIPYSSSTTANRALISLDSQRRIEFLRQSEGVPVKTVEPATC